MEILQKGQKIEEQYGIANHVVKSSMKRQKKRRNEEYEYRTLENFKKNKMPRKEVRSKLISPKFTNDMKTELSREKGSGRNS